MGYTLIKTIVSALIITLVSEVAKRSPALAALIASLPLVSVLGMAPDYGATCGFFAIDDKTLEYYRMSGREEHVDAIESYLKVQGMSGPRRSAVWRPR